MVRTSEHRAALEAVVLTQFSTARSCDRKANKPPGATALAERARLMGPEGVEPFVDQPSRDGRGRPPGLPGHHRRLG